MQETLVTTCFADLKVKPIEWLVPDYLPRGKLSLLAGDGGHGKSTLTLHLAACLTTGRPAFGLNYEPPPPASVLVVCCEDDYEDTVLPRALAAGADIARLHKVDHVKDKHGQPRPFCMEHYQAIANTLNKHPDICMTIIDPAGAYIGNVNDNNDTQLRRLLGPLAEVAAHHLSAFELVKHLNKGDSLKAVDRVGGSKGYVNAVRSAFIVAPDPDEPDTKLFLPMKFNLGPWPAGLRYRLVALPAADTDRLLTAHAGHLTTDQRRRLATQLYHIEWLGETSTTANELIAAERMGTPRGLATDAILAMQANGITQTTEIVDTLGKLGISRATAFRALQDLRRETVIPQT